VKRIIALLLALHVLPAAATQPCPLLTRSEPLGGGTLVYNTVGTGSAVVLVHGLFADKEQWSPLACRLSAKGYSVVAMDLPGYGGSTGFALDDYRLEREVEHLHALAARLGLARFDIAGNSMGGAIAVLYARRYPAQVRSVALLGSPQGIEGWSRGVREAIYAGVNPFIPVTQSQLDMELKLLFVVPPVIAPQAREGVVAKYVKQQDHYVQVWNIVNIYNDVLLQNPLPPGRPALIVWGSSDRVFDVAGAPMLQRAVHGSRLYELENAGHLLHFERARDVAVVYGKFLRDVATGVMHESPAASTRGASRDSLVAAADFTCIGHREITAIFRGDPNPGVELSFADGRTLYLPQAISASGARYASGDGHQVFWNKGNTASVTEEGKVTYHGCVTGD
jgi:pimeloyl-ACP methyl ester carboxylesterase/membrane-bound inhibitor of C-type lysozyme